MYIAKTCGLRMIISLFTNLWKICSYLQYAFICKGNSINDSVLCAYSAPLHPDEIKMLIHCTR